MRNIIFSVIACIPFLTIGQGWDPISPEGASVDFYNFMPVEHYVSQDVLYVKIGDGFESFDYSLPITSTAPLNDSIILVAVGDGSYSDGVYMHNANTNMSEVAEYFYKPKVLEKYNDTYFVGFEGGLSMSANGQVWVNILNFSSPNTVVDFYVDEENYIAVVDDNENNYIHYSSDEGDNWVSYPLNLTPTVCAYESYNSRLIVVDGGEDAVSGVYASTDFGETFDDVVLTKGLTSAHFVSNDELAIGYGARETDPQGIIILDFATNVTRQITGDIPNDDINSITFNPYINCMNLIACTQNGVYMTCNLTGMQEIQEIENTVRVYPNPVTSASVISINLDYANNGDKVAVMNVNGQIMAETNLVLNGNKTFSLPLYNLIDNLSSGIYFVQIISNSGKTNSIKFLVE